MRVRQAMTSGYKTGGTEQLEEGGQIRKEIMLMT